MQRERLIKLKVRGSEGRLSRDAGLALKTRLTRRAVRERGEIAITGAGRRSFSRRKSRSAAIIRIVTLAFHVLIETDPTPASAEIISSVALRRSGGSRLRSSPVIR